MKKTTNFLLILFATVHFLGSCGKNPTQISPAESNEKLIKSFVFHGLNPAVECAIDNNTRTITAVVPASTDRSQLSPTITVSNYATVSPGSKVRQDFTNAVSYTVRAMNGSQQTYTVYITAGVGAGSSGIITTVAGNGTKGFSGDGGQATDASINYCTDITVDAAGNIYLCDAHNSRIRKVNTSGVISTIAGNGLSVTDGDGGLATDASFSLMAGLTIDASGNIYIACYDRVRKINTSGYISTVAGGGSLTVPNKGDGGLATDAVLMQPRDVAVNATGDLIIADWGNHRVRKVSGSTGIITTILGNGSLTNTGDGGLASAATMKYPTGIAIDGTGNIYVSNSEFIRKINTSGIVSTFAGSSATGAAPADGSHATTGRLGAHGIALDRNGNLLLAVNGSQLVRKVNTTTGIVTTVAGGAYTLGDGGPATMARLSTPSDVAVDVLGNIYIADYNEWRVRKVTQ